MDKEFKRIFDELRKTADTAGKVYKVMNNYQEHLDMMVETGLMDEHEARMDFFCKTNEVLAQVAAADDDEDEDEDNDAEDEQCDGDDESCEGCKSADEAVAETVSFFVEHQDIWQALSGLVNAMRDAGVSGSVCFHNHDESRKTDRG